MNKKDYIGIDLANHLHEKGFKKESEYVFDVVDFDTENERVEFVVSELVDDKHKFYPAYSYYQILTSLAKELFGEERVISCCEANERAWKELSLRGGYWEYKSSKIAYIILEMLQQNKPQEDIDFYIKSNLIDKWK